MLRLRILLCCAALSASVAAAPGQFDPGRVTPQTPGVARLYPPPAARYETPSFAPGRNDFTSHDEMLATLAAVARARPDLARVEVLGTSQEGRAIAALVLAEGDSSAPALAANGRPTVLVIGQQHGNEPAGGEALLALAQRLGGERSALLGSVNVVLIPRGNPDGAHHFRRTTTNGIDVNRDHTMERTPEARAIGGAVRAYRPHVVVDAHEFTAGGRWITSFGGLARPDVTIQYATTANLAPALMRAQAEPFHRAMVTAFERERLVHDWYYTLDNRRPSIVNMGGILADTGRNVAGLRNAVSFLIETRGVGIGRDNWLRRVHAHVVAIEAVLSAAADHGEGVRASVAAAARESGDPAVLGPLVVLAEPTLERRAMVFVDPASGEERRREVEWNSSLTLRPTLTRAWPAGYLLPPEAEAAAQRLAGLGIAVQRLTRAQTVPVERYRVLELRTGPKEDVRGDDTGAGDILIGRFATEPGEAELPPGSFFVATAQPLAGLIAALIEPESAVGYVANRVVALGPGQAVPILRVMALPSEVAADRPQR